MLVNAIMFWTEFCRTAQRCSIVRKSSLQYAALGSFVRRISWRSVLRSVVRLLLSQAFLLPLSVTQCCSDLIRYVVHY